VPTVVLSRPILWEVADFVEQTFFIACTENLHPRPENIQAALPRRRPAGTGARGGRGESGVLCRP